MPSPSVPSPKLLASLAIPFASTSANHRPSRPNTSSSSPPSPSWVSLAQWLEIDGKRQRRCAKQLFEDLLRLGYQGAYDSMQRFVRDHKPQAFVPLLFVAGKAYQFDWNEEVMEIDGVVQRVKAAHFRLTHSRQPFVMVFPRETQEMVFAAHDAAFHYWGGVPRQGIYDNLKTCVEQVLEGKERRFNPRAIM